MKMVSVNTTKKYYAFQKDSFLIQMIIIYPPWNCKAVTVRVMTLCANSTVWSSDNNSPYCCWILLLRYDSRAYLYSTFYFFVILQIWWWWLQITNNIIKNIHCSASHQSAPVSFKMVNVSYFISYVLHTFYFTCLHSTFFLISSQN